MKGIKLSKIITILPDGLGLFIGEKAKELNKRYCYGQPQLNKDNKMIFCDSFIDGIRNFRGLPEFPTLFIDCEN